MSSQKTVMERFKRRIKELTGRLMKEKSEMLDTVAEKDVRILSLEKELTLKTGKIEVIKNQMEEKFQLKEEELCDARKEKKDLNEQITKIKNDFINEAARNEKSKERLQNIFENKLKEIAGRIEKEAVVNTEKLDELEKDNRNVRLKHEIKDFMLRTMRKYFEIKSEVDLLRCRLEEKIRSEKIRAGTKSELGALLQELVKRLEEERISISVIVEKLHEEKLRLAANIMNSPETPHRNNPSTAQVDKVPGTVSYGVKMLARSLEAEKVTLEKKLVWARKSLRDAKKKYYEKDKELIEKEKKHTLEVAQLQKKQAALEMEVMSLKNNIQLKDNELNSLTGKVYEMEKAVLREKEANEEFSIDRELENLEKIFEEERRYWKEKMHEKNIGVPGGEQSE